MARAASALLIGLSTDQSHHGKVPVVEGRLQQVVGENLRRVRRQLGYSQESFGEHVGWHRTFVGAVERGERNLTLRTVERISEQLNVHPLELLWDRTAVRIETSPGGIVHVVEDGADAQLAAADGRPGGTPGRKRARPKLS